jgi:hypothetical protein
MSSADIEAWESLLCSSLDMAADCGVENIEVLDYVAVSLSATHCPTTTACVRIADLLVSRLEFGEARDIPRSLAEYAKDALESAYPPEPKNKMYAIWLLRSVVTALDKCPPEVTPALAEHLQDGLTPWIQDACEAFEEEEYIFNVLPLYQTICVAAQTLSPSATALESFSLILESAFLGRTSKPEAMAQSFKDFWSASFGLLDAREHRWPTRIQTCLDAITGSENVDATPKEYVQATLPKQEIVMSEIEDVERLLFPDSDDNSDVLPLSDLPPFSPTRTVFDSISRPSTPPSTPRTVSGSGIFSTPTRPNKLPSSSLYSGSLSSPLSARTSPGSSPSRRRRPSDARDKENLAPLPSKPLSTSESLVVLGKRRELQEDSPGDIDVFGSKKARTVHPPSPEVPFRVGPPKSRKSIDAAELFTSRKRKHTIITVELPTLKEVRRRTLSDVPLQKDTAIPFLRRPRSLNALDASSAIDQADDEDLAMTPRKRRRTINELTLDASLDTSSLFGSGGCP